MEKVTVDWSRVTAQSETEHHHTFIGTKPSLDPVATMFQRRDKTESGYGVVLGSSAAIGCITNQKMREYWSC